MKRTELIEMYQQLIDENLQDIEFLCKEIKYWEEIYKKRIFEVKTPASIKQSISLIKNEVLRNIEETKYYLSRAKEVRSDYAKACDAQLEADKRDVAFKGGESEDTNKILT